MKLKVEAPVIVFFYDRVICTKRLLKSFQKIHFKQLYFFQDGPKSTKEKNKKEIKTVTYLLKQFSKTRIVNLETNKSNCGLKNQIATKVSNVLQKESTAIILEDDCLPSLDFFRFCDFGLKKYQANDEVMSITGDCFIEDAQEVFFSRYAHCWGWATWARAWEKYDDKLETWMQFKKGKKWINDFSFFERNFWEPLLDRVQRGEINSWAYRWLASIWTNNGLVLSPPVNLVSNIGFGQQATNCKTKSPFANIPAGKLIKVSFPEKIERNKKYDDKVFFKVFYSGKKKHNRFVLSILMLRYYVKKIWSFKYV